MVQMSLQISTAMLGFFKQKRLEALVLKGIDLQHFLNMHYIKKHIDITIKHGHMMVIDL